MQALSPVELVILQGTSFCNLNCTYCDLSAESRRRKSRMEPALIERFFTELFGSGRFAPEVTIVWHSGEPLTLSQSYYHEAISNILRLRDALAGSEVSVRFRIQTNGTLIDDEWCRFFRCHEEHLQLGVSCDGPTQMHDAFRINWSGRPSHEQAIRGMNLLNDFGIKYKVIAVVTRRTLGQPDEFYSFFYNRRQQLSGFHFNVLAEGKSEIDDLSYTTADRLAYYKFYRRLLELDRTFNQSEDGFKILNFSQCAGRILGSRSPNAPVFFDDSTAPLKSLNLDSEGIVTTFYAGLNRQMLPDEYGDGQGFSLGNISSMSLEEMAQSDKLQRMMADLARSRESCRSSCEYFSLCPGGFDMVKRRTHGTFEASETQECVIHVKALTDAVLDDMSDYVIAHDALESVIQ
jgi:uncharacterized protein